VLTSQGCYNDFTEVNKITQMIPFINGMTYVAEKNLRIFNETGVSLTQNKKLIFNGLSKDISVVYKNRKDFGLSHEDFVIGQITRSIPEKGMEISILAALALIEKGYHHVKLIVMGPENEYYLSLKNKYTSPNILFLGSTQEPLAYVNLFDVGILPSYFPSESCPSTIVEYLAGNKPVIATNIGEIPNMIKTNDDLAGILVEEKDALGLPSVEHFSLAIEQYLLNNNLYTKHKSLCALAFEKFELEKIVEEYELIYKIALLA
jgi:glycosyltransferase involved in cell wall biosynthesis